MKYPLIIIILLLCTSCFNNIDKSKMHYMDYNLFMGTDAEALAKAVKAGDTAAIKEEVLIHKIPVDTRNEEFGTTLLMMATYLNNIKLAKCLLELGADPNLYIDCDTTKDWSENSVILASRLDFTSPELLSLLIAYGGDPNTQTIGNQEGAEGEYIPLKISALEFASGSSLEKVKILVEGGADINRITDESFGSKSTPLYSSIVHHQMDILLYLLNNGADYNQTFMMEDFSKPSGIYNEYTILDLLRETCDPYNPVKQKQKKEVINFLAKKGLDYSKAPIPDWVVNWAKENRPDDWEEYLANY